jgi:hypothetical protein
VDEDDGGISHGILLLGIGIMGVVVLQVACAAAAVVSPVRGGGAAMPASFRGGLHLVDRGVVEGHKPLRHEGKTAQLLLGVPEGVGVDDEEDARSLASSWPA